MADITEKLERLASLLERGLITREQFEVQRDAILSGTTGAGMTPVPTPSAPDLLAGATRVAPASLPDQLGSYRVLETIGEGGMGKVVRARHMEESWARRQGGDVAIKIVHPNLAADSSFRERFLDEAHLGKRLRHASLAQVHDVIVEGSWLGAVMSFIEGEDLSQRIPAGGLPLAASIALLRPIAEALDELHSQGIIHRDLKPDNIKVRPDGSPVILDLGIAKDTESGPGLTRTSTTMGTTGWMAPEQADAKNVTPAADRYALGMIAYALLSGRMPWETDLSEARMLVVKMTDALLPLSQAKPDLPAHVSRAVMAMVALEPGDRPETCAAFVDQMSEAAQPVAAMPEPVAPAPPAPAPVAPAPPRQTEVQPTAPLGATRLEDPSSDDLIRFQSRDRRIRQVVLLSVLLFGLVGVIFIGLAVTGGHEEATGTGTGTRTGTGTGTATDRSYDDDDYKATGTGRSYDDDDYKATGTGRSYDDDDYGSTGTSTDSATRKYYRTGT